LNVFLERRGEKFPGVTRDIFRMVNPPKPKPATPPPPVHVKTPEELAAEAAQAAANAANAAAQAAAEAARIDLSKFSFLGYLTDKDNTLFLSKEGQLFIVKSGGLVLGNYKVKEAGKDSVVLLDTVTRVEVRIYLSGGAPPALQQQQPPQKSPQQLQPQPSPQPSPPPGQQRPPIYRKLPASG
jgi:cell division septation protein DedD